MSSDEYSLDPEHPSASHFLFLSAHDRDGGSMFVIPTVGAVWQMTDRQGVEVAAGNNMQETAGYHQSAALPMLRDAIRKTPDRSHIHLITRIRNFATLANYGPQVRAEKRYRGSGKKRWAGDDQWRSLDAELVRRQITVTAGEPQGDMARHILERAGLSSSTIARNAGQSFGKWEL